MHNPKYSSTIRSTSSYYDIIRKAPPVTTNRDGDNVLHRGQSEFICARLSPPVLSENTHQFVRVFSKRVRVTPPNLQHQQQCCVAVERMPPLPPTPVVSYPGHFTDQKRAARWPDCCCCTYRGHIYFFFILHLFIILGLLYEVPRFPTLVALTVRIRRRGCYRNGVQIMTPYLISSRKKKRKYGIRHRFLTRILRVRIWKFAGMIFGLLRKIQRPGCFYFFTFYLFDRCMHE